MSLCAAAVSVALDQDVEDKAIVIDGAPEPMLLARDRDEDLASRAGESHPHALPEPYVTFSVIRLPMFGHSHAESANGRRDKEWRGPPAPTSLLRLWAAGAAA